MYTKGLLFKERRETSATTRKGTPRDEEGEKRGTARERGREEQDTRREFAEFWLGEHTSGHYRSLST